MNARVLLCCLVIAGLSMGCSDENNPEAVVPVLDLMPLTIGNSWVWEVQTNTPEQSIYTIYDTLFVDGTITDSTGAVWYTVDAGGYYRNSLRGLEFTYGWDIVCLRYPAPTGEEGWYSFAGMPYHVRVVNNDTLVTCPAGMFHCVEHAIHDTAGYLEYTFHAPGTGLIRSVRMMNDTTVWRITQLIECNIQ